MGEAAGCSETCPADGCNCPGSIVEDHSEVPDEKKPKRRRPRGDRRRGQR